MDIRNNVSLKDHSTMRLGGTAAHLVTVSNLDDIQEAVAWAEERNLPVMMIGDGSNIVWRDEGFPGLILVCNIKGFEVQEVDGATLVTIGAGENWDSVVGRVVELGLSGIEGLSLIPGTAGATPIQNVGAYGQEISQTLVSLEAYDTQTKQLVTIPNEECAFSYRKSRFNAEDRGRFLIISITLRLKHENPQPPYYRTVDLYFQENNIQGECTPQVMRDAVIAIRRSKLPDPAEVANNGSFFGNPVVDNATYERLHAEYDDLPYRDMGDGTYKLSAAWMIEKVGLKGFHDNETGMATWPKQPLVFVNEKADSTEQLIQFRQKVAGAVQDQFGVTLKQEPELLP